MSAASAALLPALYDRSRGALRQGASAARTWNGLRGGKDCYEVDREVVGELLKVAPFCRNAVRISREFTRHAAAVAVRAGVRQFLDLGCGLPDPYDPDLHEVAARHPGGVRILYVDHDPHVIAHRAAMTTVEPPSVAAHLLADILDLAAVVGSAEAAEAFDLSQPVGVHLHDVLHLVPDDAAAHTLLGALADWLPVGSYLSITHPTADFDPTAMACAAELYRAAGLPVRLRTRHEVTALLAGLDLLEPGVAATGAWLTGRLSHGLPQRDSAAWAAIAAVP